MPEQKDIARLTEELVNTHRDLEVRSSAGSLSSESRLSESRDSARQAVATIEDLEAANRERSGTASRERSSAGSGSSGQSGGAGSGFQKRLRGSGSLHASSSASHTHSEGKITSESPSYSQTSGSGTIYGTSFGGLSSAQQIVVENSLEQVRAQHRIEMEALQLQLSNSLARESNRGEDNIELQEQVARLLQKEYKNENLQNLLDKARKGRKDASDERDDLLDKIAGMEALELARQKKQKVDMDELKTTHAEAMEFQAKEDQTSQDTILAELAIARQEVQASYMKTKAMTNEMNLAQRNESQNEKKHATDLADLQHRLNAANREIKRQKAKKGDTDFDQEDFKQQRNLEDLLTNSRDANRDLQNQLADLRMELFANQKAHEGKVLQLEAENSRNALQKKKAQARKPLEKGGKAPLASIGEEDDDLCSQAASAISGQVSSAGGGVVGDLADFDEDEDDWTRDAREKAKKARTAETFVERLQSELAEAGLANQQLKDEAIGQNAANFNKVKRMLEKIEQQNKEVERGEAELEKAKQAHQDDSKAQAVELKAAQEQVRVLQASLRSGDQDQLKMMSEVEEALNLEKEKNRIEALRFTDIRDSMAKMESSHAREVTELMSKISTDKGCVPDSVFLQIRELEEERNVLRNEVECLKVHAQGLIENEAQAQISLEAALVKAAKATAMLEEEKEGKQILQDHITKLQSQIAAALVAKGEAELKLTQTPVAEMKTGLFRCPARSTTQPTAQRSDPHSKHSTQKVLWQTLNHIPDVMLLLCAERSLKITEGSRRAHALWGSVALRSKTLPQLMHMYDKNSSAWLKQEIADHPTGGNFTIQDIGFIEFDDKHGASFESTVICVHMPAEASNGKASSLLMIINRLNDELQAPQQPVIPVRPAPKASSRISHQIGPRDKSSSSLSVATEDITANDSISNVMA